MTVTIETVAIASLTLDPANARTHDERNLAAIKGSLKQFGSIKKSKDRIVGEFSQLQTVYRGPAQKARDDIDHPARFPVDFPEAYIEALTDRNESVYEPFTGSGSTLIACQKTGRRCFGMEIDTHYCDVILKRWEDFTGREATLDSGEIAGHVNNG